MSYDVFRDKKGRFSKRENAFSHQKVIDNKWQKLTYLIVEIGEPEHEEFEYFIGFDYETSRKAMKTKGKHDFKTEFRVSSPSSLTDGEIKNLIQSKFSDYGVLRNDNAYEIKSESRTPKKEKPKITVKFTSKIER